MFYTHLQLDSEPRARLNDLLLSKSFEPRLEKLIAETDELVSAPFFWNDQAATRYSLLITPHSSSAPR